MDPFEIIFTGDFGWEINYRMLSLALAEAGGKDLFIKVNSPGGDVPEATAIRNSLETYAKKHGAKVTFEVVGWAQSAMTHVMSMKGAKVIVHPDSMYMYHNPQTFVAGDHIAMEEAGDFLKTITEVYAIAYAERSGKDLAVTKAEMARTTCFVGQAIIDNGFADEMDESSLDYVAGGTTAVVAFGRQQLDKCFGRLAAAAYGNDLRSQPPSNTMLPGDGVKPPAKKEDTNMGEPKKEVPEVDAGELRVAAWSDAMQAAPVDQHTFLKTCLAQKKDAAFFNGLQTSYEMQAEAKVLAESKTLTPAGSKVPEVKIENQDKPKSQPATPGMTGEMFVC